MKMHNLKQITKNFWQLIPIDKVPLLPGQETLSGHSVAPGLRLYSLQKSEHQRRRGLITHPPCSVWLYSFQAEYSLEVRGMKFLGAVKGLLVGTECASELCATKKRLKQQDKTVTIILFLNIIILLFLFLSSRLGQSYVFLVSVSLFEAVAPAGTAFFGFQDPGYILLFFDPYIFLNHSLIPGLSLKLL